MRKKSLSHLLTVLGFLLLFSLLPSESYAQLFKFDKKGKKEKKENKKESGKKETEEGEALTVDPEVDVPATINLEEEEEEEDEEEKKKRKKNVYYGLKTKKGFTKKGFGDREVLTLFHYLKEYQDPNPYIRDVYWYDTESGMIKKSYNVDKEHARILHGPYKRMLGNQVIEEGIFYIGTKHGRWTEFNKNDILTNKEKYIKGWPKESEISYYDRSSNKIKEVTPVEFGKKEGNYYYFFDNGQVAVLGEYQQGTKVGVWKEYYKGIRKRKKEVQYREDPYDEDFKPFILREWDKNGKLIYEHESASKK